MTSQIGRVVSVRMLETPATAPIYSKRMKSNINAGTVRRYEDATNGGKIHSESLLASIANSSIYYSSEGAKQINMPGGYDETRFRISLEFVESSMGSGEVISRITGYTDVYDYTNGRGGLALPPDMKIYFNEIRTVAVRRQNNFRGAADRTVREVSNILTRLDQKPSGRNINGESTHLLTPSVITQVMQAEDIHKTLGIAKDEIEINDTRTHLMLNNNYRSRAVDKVPTHYLTRVLDGYSRSRQRDLNGSDDKIKLLANAVKQNNDPSIANSKFFELLLSDTEYDFDGYITWREFERLFPEVTTNECDVHIHEMEHGVLRRTPSLDSCTRWDDNSLETVIAQIVVSGIAPMMPDLNVEYVGFVIHNETRDGSLSVSITDIRSIYDDIDLDKEIDAMIYRISEFLFSGCEFVDNVQFHCQGHVAQMGESVIYCSVDNAEDQVYRFANWADALGTPLLSDNQRDVFDMADDIKKLIGVIDDNVDASREQKLILDDVRLPSRGTRSRGL